MIPILFPANATTFTNEYGNLYGIGSLSKASRCFATMEGQEYELQFDYLVSGPYFSEITPNKIVFAKPNQTDNEQPFRIYRITKPVSGKVTVYAHHLSYDLSGIPVNKFKATSAADFVTKITENVLVTCPFTFETNVVMTDDLEFDFPMSAREMISEWAEKYKGELVFDGYTVKLLQSAGQNRGVKIRYGVDIVDATMEENISSCATGIVPYYLNSKTGAVTLGDVLNAQGTFDHTKIIPVDVSDYIVSSSPTKAKVNEVGAVWLAENAITLAEISLKLTYAQIDQVVRLGDTVSVEIDRLGIDLLAKVSSTDYDVIEERYRSVNVGDVRETFANDLWDASRLKTGLLNMKRIKDKSITNKKMGSGSVNNRTLEDGSVNTWKLDDHAVTSDKIDNGAVTSAKINDGAVTAAKIPAGSIARDKINTAFETALSTVEKKLSGELASQIKTSSFYIKRGASYVLVYVGENGELITRAP